MYRDPSGEPHHLVPDRAERLTINLGDICHTHQQHGASVGVKVDQLDDKVGIGRVDCTERVTRTSPAMVRSSGSASPK
jgi:hypothetical protein